MVQVLHFMTSEDYFNEIFFFLVVSLLTIALNANSMVINCINQFNENLRWMQENSDLKKRGLFFKRYIVNTDY